MELKHAAEAFEMTLTYGSEVLGVTGESARTLASYDVPNGADIKMAFLGTPPPATYVLRAMMPASLHSLIGPSVLFPTKPMSTLDDVKAKLEVITGIPVAEQSLYWDGNNLANVVGTLSLSGIGIKNEDALVLRRTLTQPDATLVELGVSGGLLDLTVLGGPYALGPTPNATNATFMPSGVTVTLVLPESIATIMGPRMALELSVDETLAEFMVRFETLTGVPPSAQELSFVQPPVSYVTIGCNPDKTPTAFFIGLDGGLRLEFLDGAPVASLTGQIGPLGMDATVKLDALTPLPDAMPELAFGESGGTFSYDRPTGSLELDVNTTIATLDVGDLLTFVNWTSQLYVIAQVAAEEHQGYVSDDAASADGDGDLLDAAQAAAQAALDKAQAALDKAQAALGQVCLLRFSKRPPALTPPAPPLPHGSVDVLQYPSAPRSCVVLLSRPMHRAGRTSPTPQTCSYIPERTSPCRQSPRASSRSAKGRRKAAQP